VLPYWRKGIEATVENSVQRDAFLFGLYTGMRRGEVLARPLTKRLVNHTRLGDVTEGYAADWTVEQLRGPARRIADRIDA